MFKHVPCGETLPVDNVHAVSVSIPTFKDVISYEEGRNTEIKSGYPRFVLHPYLKKMALHLEQEYAVDEKQEVVLVSSQDFANLIIEKYHIKQKLNFKENFGVVLIQKETDELQSVLRFIQHVGCNLSSRFAEEYLYEKGLIDSLHVELKTVQKIQSGMVIQLGWLYLDSMNLIEGYDFKIFYDVMDLKLVENFLQNCIKKVSCIVTEVPTNPLLQSVDLKELKRICLKYDVALVVDSTFATAYTRVEEADILIESLTKFACGNADVLMGCFILNDKYTKYEELFKKDLDKPYIKDIQRLAFEIKGYETRVKIANKNKDELVKFLEQKSYVKKVYHSSLSAVISVVFNMPFEKVYDTLNFHKGPSLGTEFTLLMPYVYLAHYDLITCSEGRELLRENKIPIELIRISVGVEDINFGKSDERGI